MPELDARTAARLARAVAWTACLLPVAWLIWRIVEDGLGVNPPETLLLWAGRSGLILLLATLAITPIRRLTGWNAIARVRRLLGLSAFSYACLHFLTYAGLDQLFSPSAIADDVRERPFITVGFTAYVLLIPLAVTSTNGWIRRLGPRWRRLHRLVYVAAGLGVLHFFWLVKADTREPLAFAAVLGALLLLRLKRRTGRRAPQPRPPAEAARPSAGSRRIRPATRSS